MPPSTARKTKPANAPVSRPSKKMANVLILHAAKAEKVQKAASKLEQTHQRLLKRAEVNASIVDQIFAASLAVIRCTNLPSLRATVQTTLKQHLGVDAVRFLLIGTDSATTITPQALEALFPTTSNVALRRLATAQDRDLYGPKGKLLKSDCLLRLTDGTTVMGLLALGSHDETHFHSGQSTHMAAYLAQVIGTCLTRLANQ